MSILETPQSSAPPLSHQIGWAYTYHLIIARSTAPCLLLLRDGAGWALPRFHPVEHDLRAVAHIERAVRHGLNRDARVLRCISADRSHEEAKRVEAIFTLEVSEAGPPPAVDFRWLGATELTEITWTLPAQREIIVAWLRSRDIAQAAPVHPWLPPGWQTTVIAWIAERLNQYGIEPVVAVEQVRTWSLSCVLRARTSQGDYYLKALPPAYRSEVAITSFLATRFHNDLPGVLATEHERGWILLEDVGPLMDNDRLDLWESAVTRIAAIQRSMIPDSAHLLALGCQDQRLGALATQAEALTASPHVRAALSHNEYQALCALIPHLQARCSRLAKYGLPETLVHGDLHTGNIAQRSDRLTFFDWGDACIAHPFVVLFALLDERYFPRGLANVATHLRDLYLAQWADFDSPERLREALDLADSLAALRYTFGCVRCFPSLDSFWTRELARSLRSSLCALIAAK